MRSYVTILSCFFAAGLATPALAEGFYVGGSGDAVFLDEASNSGDGNIDIESETATGFGLTGQAGYAFANGFRLEGELGYRQNDMDKLTIANDGGVFGGAFNGLSADADGDVSSLSVMANGYYDLYTDSPWRPYIGAGIGLARLNADISLSGTKLVDDNDTVLAYQLMVGVGYRLAPNTTVFGGYRYFATEDPELETESGVSFESEYQAHVAELGVRVAF